MLDPLLFNIYINDIFYFMDQSEITNYADDNTPYAVDDDIDVVLQKLKSVQCRHCIFDYFNCWFIGQCNECSCDFIHALPH